MEPAQQSSSDRRRLAVLARTAIASGAIWLITSVVLAMVRLLDSRALFEGHGITWIDWAQFLGTVAYGFFIVTTGLWLIVWLDRRWREE